MTARHSTLFTLGSGQSGLGFYTTQRDAARKRSWSADGSKEMLRGEYPHNDCAIDFQFD